MKSKLILSILLLILLSAVAYLPLASRFGYTHDDWYLMYSAGAYGPSVFRDIFSVDRPMRALVMIPAYYLFGANPLYYNLSAYVFRVLGALAFFWILNLLWSRQRTAATLAAALFVIYPGFLSQPNGIDYQSHIMGLAAALFSVALTLQAIRSESRAATLGLHFLATLTGVFYLGQMEWYIGFEFFRWACVFLLSAREGGTLVQKARRAVEWAYPSFAGPGLFLLWRIFFFESERGATDVGFQLLQFSQYPIQTLYHWAVQVAQDVFDVLFAAWVIPLAQLTGYIQRWGGALALLTSAALVVWLYRSRLGETSSEPEQADFTREAFWLGAVTVAGGLIPIAIVNRDVVFPAFSRYSLVSSAGVALLIVAISMQMNKRALQVGFIAVLGLIALLTHHANAVKYAGEAAALKNFWWQVSWRVPQFEKNATLLAVYPAGVIEEDYFVWGPANLIYYPEKQNEKNIQPGLFAALVNRDTVAKVLTRQRQEYDKRKNIVTYANYRNILILSQPTASACVRVMDGTRPELSRWDLDAIRVMSPYSELEHVLADETPHAPPEIVFGPEPTHGWCFFYQKADLARQQGDWQAVLEMGNQAFDLNLSPADPIEWMPFLQAYAVTGNVERLTELAPVVTADPYVAQQACGVLQAMSGLSDSIKDVIGVNYCIEP
jgi:hypothetical protein